MSNKKAGRSKKRERELKALKRKRKAIKEEIRLEKAEEQQKLIRETYDKVLQDHPELCDIESFKKHYLEHKEEYEDLELEDWPPKDFEKYYTGKKLDDAFSEVWLLTSYDTVAKYLSLPREEVRIPVISIMVCNDLKKNWDKYEKMYGKKGSTV